MNPQQTAKSPNHSAPVLVLKLGVALLALVPLAGALRADAAGSLTAADVIERGEERFRTLQDYNCTVELEAKKGGRVETGTCQFWFKQPRMLRLKVLRGSRKGSEVTVSGTGQIRGHQGGLFKGIVRRMKTSDPRLLTIRGSSMMGLDWGSFFLKYHAAALSPGARVTLAPREDSEAPYQVQVSYPLGGKRVREVYSLAAQRWTIVEGSVYEDDVRVEHVTFEDVKLDTGLADGWFSL
jgi:outer membrane lipoprotein-sorting protein